MNDQRRRRQTAARVTRGMVAAVIGLLLCLPSTTGADEARDLDRALKLIGDRQQDWTTTEGSYDEGVRLLAVDPVKRVAAFGKPAVPKLLVLLRTGTEDQRWDSLIALGLIGPDAVASVRDVLAYASTPGWEEPALLALASIAPADPSLRELVVKMFAKDPPEPYVVVAFGAVLSRESTAADRRRLIALAAKRADMDDDAEGQDPDAARAARKRNNLASAAAWALGRQGAEAAEAVEVLLPHAEAGHAEYALALERIGTPKARAAVLRLARSKRVEVAYPAVQALGHTKPPSPVAMQILRAALEDEVRCGAALEAAARLGEHGRPLIPKILPLLAPPSLEFVRCHALEVLPQLGMLDAASRKAVVAATKDPSADVRELARRILDRSAKREAGGGG